MTQNCQHLSGSAFVRVELDLVKRGFGERAQNEALEAEIRETNERESRLGLIDLERGLQLRTRVRADQGPGLTYVATRVASSVGNQSTKRHFSDIIRLQTWDAHVLPRMVLKPEAAVGKF